MHLEKPKRTITAIVHVLRNWSQIIPQPEELKPEIKEPGRGVIEPQDKFFTAKLQNYQLLYNANEAMMEFDENWTESRTKNEMTRGAIK